MKYQIRDVLAIPFWVLAIELNKLAIKIGGVWTEKLFMDELSFKVKKEL